MADISKKPIFKWTEQKRREARLRAALGDSVKDIADHLGCDRGTAGRFLGPRRGREALTLHALYELFERYDGERNIIEAVRAESGSAQQSRLRSSLRSRVAASRAEHSAETDSDPDEELSDEELRAEVERLVGHPIRLRQ